MKLDSVRDLSMNDGNLQERWSFKHQHREFKIIAGSENQLARMQEGKHLLLHFNSKINVHPYDA